MRMTSGTTSNTGRPGFTLIELLVSIAIIALLITLVTVGAAHASKLAKGTSERQTVVQLNQAVQAFKQEFGFLPPLVTHSDTIKPVGRDVNNGLVINSYGGNVADNTKSYNGNAGFLEGFSSKADPGTAGSTIMSSDWAAASGTGSGSTAPDRRFSEYSLAYFLVGALGRDLDGVDGPGMFKPKADGTFDFGTTSNSSRVNKALGRSYPPFVDTSRKSPKLETDLTAAAADTGMSTNDRNTGALTAQNVRYQLLSPSGKPYRYYRWAPRKIVTATITYFDPEKQTFTRPEDSADLLDVPSLLGDPRTNADLRGAEYAIVSPGADAYFGDLNIEAATFIADKQDDLAEIASKVGVKMTTDRMASSTAVRKAARADNIVEVGR